MNTGDIIQTPPPYSSTGWPIYTGEVPPPSPSEGMAWFKVSASEFKVMSGGVWSLMSNATSAGLPASGVAGQILMSDATLAWKPTDTINLGNF